MIRTVISNWNLMRLLRLASGILVLAAGARSGEWAYIIFGGAFTLMALLNWGCCRTTVCSNPVSLQHKKKEDVNFEEVH